MLRIYIQYVNNYNTAVMLLSELKKKKQFKKWLNVVMRDDRIHLSTLEDYLITPVQRIPRYTMLFDELVKITEETHPDYEGLIEAHSVLGDITGTINEKKREAESVTKVIALHESIEFENPEDKFVGCDIFSNNRIFRNRAESTSQK